MNHASIAPRGIVCPVRGCDKKDNRRFSYLGIAQHLIVKHREYYIKKLNLKIKDRKSSGIL